MIRPKNKKSGNRKWTVNAVKRYFRELNKKSARVFDVSDPWVEKYHPYEWSEGDETLNIIFEDLVTGQLFYGRFKREEDSEVNINSFCTDERWLKKRRHK